MDLSQPWVEDTSLVTKVPACVADAATQSCRFVFFIDYTIDDVVHR